VAIEAWHVGILVSDIDQAIEDFSSALGLEFAPVQGMETEMHGAMEGSFLTRATFSKAGPMHLELIQGTDTDDETNMFSLRRGEGLHHIGVWSEDFTSYNATPKCLPVMSAVHLMPGDPTIWLSNPADLHGVRVEFLHEAVMRPGLEAWLHGQMPPGVAG
jgi:catechol 2,3-dioxygenase-like lactoylglutathione lyase family enzyme